MKYLIFSLTLFFSFQLRAQNIPLTMEDKQMDAYLMERKPATLTVEVKNLPHNVTKTEITYTLVHLGPLLHSVQFTGTDRTGKAKIILDENLPYQEIFLKVGEYLYAAVYVNTGLAVSIDVSKLPKDGAFMIGKGITYSGPDGDLNTVMNKNALFKNKDKQALYRKLENLVTSSKRYAPEILVGRLDSIRRELTKLDTGFIINHKNYEWAIENETLSSFYGKVCAYFFNNIMPSSLFNEIKSHKPYFISNDGADFYNYLNNYTQLGAKAGTLDQSLQRLDSVYPQQKSDIIKLLLLGREKEDFPNDYLKIINSIQTKWLKRIANKELGKATMAKKRVDSLFALPARLENLTFGTPLEKLPFNAELYKVDKVKSMDDFILNLKDKFPNKAFVFDFWATWCGPCLADLPFSKKFHENNIDLPVEYIYLCTSSSSSLELWKSKVAELQIPGIHIFMSEKNIAELKKMVGAESGYPAYVLLTSKGKVDSKIITWMQNLDRESLKKAIEF